MGGPLSGYDNSAEIAGISPTPAAQPEADISTLFQAGRTNTRATFQTQTRSYYDEDFFNEVGAKLSALGYQYQPPNGFAVTPAPQPFGSPAGSVYQQLGYKGDRGADVENQFWGALAQAQAKGFLKEIPGRADHDAQIDAALHNDAVHSQAILSDARSWQGSIAGFLGEAYQGFHDPVQLGFGLASHGAGALVSRLGASSVASGIAARAARFLAPQTSGAGATAAMIATRQTLGTMAREGAVFAIGNAALAPVVQENYKAAGLNPDAVSASSLAGQGFLMGAGFGFAGSVANPLLGAIAGASGKVSLAAIDRLYPHLPEPVRAWFAETAERTGTDGLRTDLADAIDAIHDRPGVTPAEADAVRHGASAAIDQESTPFVASAHGAETHGEMLAAERTANNLNKSPPPLAGAAYGAPKAAGLTQDSIVKFVINDLEGGANVVDYGEHDGGITKYGIAARSNPGVDVANLTEDQAASIAKSKYWFSELNSVDPRLAAIGFDAGYISGPQTGRLILRESGGDPARAIALYRDHLNAVADHDPLKAKYRKGWMARIDKLERRIGGSQASADGAANAPLSSGDPQAELAAARLRLDAQQAQNDLDGHALPQIDPQAMPRPVGLPDFQPEMPVLARSERFQVEQLTTDAQTMQYKGGGDADGVTARLRDDAPWVQGFSGKMIVWERNDGTYVIADGHQRLGKAKRYLASNPEANVWLDADVYRESDGVTADQVRTAAALKNIAEGSGDPVDAARVLREHPDLAALLPQAGELNRIARGLQMLSHEAFGAVLNNSLSVEHGAAIGMHAGHVPDRHMTLATLLSGVPKRDMAQAGHIVRQAVLDGFGSNDAAKQMHLFGEMPVEALYRPIARLIEHAKKLLRDDKKRFTLLVNDAGRIESTGANALDHGANSKKVSDSEQAAIILERSAHSAGPVRNALRDEAFALLKGKSIAAATRDFLGKIEGLSLRDVAGAEASGGADGGAGTDLGRAGAAERADARKSGGDAGARGEAKPVDDGIAGGDALGGADGGAGTDLGRAGAAERADARKSGGDAGARGEAKPVDDGIAGGDALDQLDIFGAPSAVDLRTINDGLAHDLFGDAAKAEAPEVLTQPGAFALAGTVNDDGAIQLRAMTPADLEIDMTREQAALQALKDCM
jgi:hypothetical protein